MRVLNVVRSIFALGILLVIQPATAATPPVFTEFNVGLSTNSALQNITTGPDGNFWFTQASFSGLGVSAIGRITPTGDITLFTAGLSAGSRPAKLATGLDGNLWFLDQGTTPAVGRITPAGVITEFTQGISANSGLAGLAAGPDGNMWFTIGAPAATAIGQITPAGVVTLFSEGVPREPNSITLGADGNLWVGDGSGFGMVDPSTGSFTEIIPPASMAFTDLAAGPDGNIWFTGYTLPTQQGVLGSIDPSGVVTTYSQGLNAGSSPAALIVGPDGNLWFTDYSTLAIGRITTAGAITEFATGPDLLNPPTDITAGPSNTLWAISPSDRSIVRATMPTDIVTTGTAGSGEVTSLPSGIVCGSGNKACSASFTDTTEVTLVAAPAPGFAFTGWNGANCGTIETCSISLGADTSVSAGFIANGTSDIDLVSAVLPTSRSVQVGETATVFGTMINASADTTATGCTVQAEANVATSFFFQKTDPATNLPVGNVNDPAMVPPGGAQSFVFGLTPSVNFSPTTVAFNFSCDNAPAAVSSFGLNTLLLSASAAPASDIVALSGTLTNDGIVDISGTNGTGVFVVATTNLGASAAITASANFGNAGLPIQLTICETVPATGQCLAPPTHSVNTSIAANAQPTFSIFVQGGGFVPFLPGTNRIFVQFVDSGNAVRGSTSVAVRTQ